jgi:hypothetical protein
MGPRGHADVGETEAGAAVATTTTLQKREASISRRMTVKPKATKEKAGGSSWTTRATRFASLGTTTMSLAEARQPRASTDALTSAPRAALITLPISTATDYPSNLQSMAVSLPSTSPSSTKDL